MLGFNGGLIGVNRNTSLTSATGIWTLPEQIKAYRSELWPGSSATVLTGLIQYLDAGKSNSYSGTGSAWTDISPSGGYNVTLVGNPAWTNTNGGRFDFNNNPYGTFSAPSLTSFSVSFWVNFQVASGEQRLCTFNPGASERGMAYDGTKVFFWNGVSGSPNYAATTQPINNWFNICYTSTSGAGRMYINGSLNASFADHNNIAASTSYIGSFDTAGRKLRGFLSVVMLYNKVLTAAEVLTNFNADKVRFGL
tara:strand:- start:88 stop:840 length:753 start_codon:yes stop_codon:yes gene_type:complete